MSHPSQDLNRHPMRVVARRTGLTPDLVRAWERRYQVVTPSRSGGGQRLYSDLDIERLSLLRRATDLGRNIGQIADLGLDALAELVSQDLAAQAPEVSLPAVDTTPAPEPYLLAALAAVEQFDSGRLESTLRQASLSLPAMVVMERIAAPLLSTVGARWHQGTLRASHEHLASVSVRRLLTWIITEAGAAPDAPAIVVTTPAGQVHELGALLVAATAAMEGWRVTYLGTDLPAADIAAVAAMLHPRVVGLSLVYPLDDPAVHAQLTELRRLVDPGTEILIGGGGAESYRVTIERLGLRTAQSLPEFQQLLRQFTAAPAAT